MRIKAKLIHIFMTLIKSKIKFTKSRQVILVLSVSGMGIVSGLAYGW
jgi:hypothetical protein